MDEKSDQILSHIESQRDQLGQNLRELESRVKRSTDWRTYWDENPMLLMGAALGGGVLLGALLGGKSSPSGSSTTGYSTPSSSSYTSSGLMSSPATSQARQHASETIDKIKAALIAFGTAKAKDFLASAVPGLEEHLSGLMGGSSHHQYAQTGTQRDAGQAGTDTTPPSSAPASGTGSNVGAGM